LHILEFYLNNRPQWDNFSNMEFTWVLSYVQIITHTSRTASSCSLGDYARNLTSNIINYICRTWLGMTYVPYCYEESEPINDEDDCYTNIVKKDGEDKDGEFAKLLN